MHYLGRTASDGISDEFEPSRVPRKPPRGPDLLEGCFNLGIGDYEPMDFVSRTLKQNRLEFEGRILTAGALILIMDEKQSHGSPADFTELTALFW
jgi:hypothetical protein